MTSTFITWRRTRSGSRSATTRLSFSGPCHTSTSRLRRRIDRYLRVIASFRVAHRPHSVITSDRSRPMSDRSASSEKRSAALRANADPVEFGVAIEDCLDRTSQALRDRSVERARFRSRLARPRVRPPTFVAATAKTTAQRFHDRNALRFEEAGEDEHVRLPQSMQRRRGTRVRQGSARDRRPPSSLARFRRRGVSGPSPTDRASAPDVDAMRTLERAEQYVEPLVRAVQSDVHESGRWSVRRLAPADERWCVSTVFETTRKRPRMPYDSIALLKRHYVTGHTRAARRKRDSCSSQCASSRLPDAATRSSVR